MTDLMDEYADDYEYDDEETCFDCGWALCELCGCHNCADSEDDDEQAT